MTSGNLRDYFREALGQAMGESMVRLTQHCQLYLINLLSEFSEAKMFMPVRLRRNTDTRGFNVPRRPGGPGSRSYLQTPRRQFPLPIRIFQ